MARKTWVQSPGQVIPKTQKMVLDSSLFNTQYYKVRIKGKVEQSKERSSTLPYTHPQLWSTMYIELIKIIFQYICFIFFELIKKHCLVSNSYFTLNKQKKTNKQQRRRRRRLKKDKTINLKNKVIIALFKNKTFKVIYLEFSFVGVLSLVIFIFFFLKTRLIFILSFLLNTLNAKDSNVACEPWFYQSYNKPFNEQDSFSIIHNLYIITKVNVLLIVHFYLSKYNFNLYTFWTYLVWYMSFVPSYRIWWYIKHLVYLFIFCWYFLLVLTVTLNKIIWPFVKKELQKRECWFQKTLCIHIKPWNNKIIYLW